MGRTIAPVLLLAFLAAVMHGITLAFPQRKAGSDPTLAVAIGGLDDPDTYRRARVDEAALVVATSGCASMGVKDAAV